MKDIITVKSTGDFKLTMRFLRKLNSKAFYRKIEEYAKMGVEALISATPKDTGETADSWDYQIEMTSSSVVIYWTNSVMAGSTPLALLIDVGHGTKNGRWVEGEHYITPAIKPVFEKISDDVWREVTS